ncbi:hypothetical protein IMF27_21945 [Pseudomonas sp. PCH199]|uniref:hypothetical protein n=1 Tax=unclassified Pseudomonas TaxID=196821 RepID=UPI000BC48586|nr:MULTISPECIES: hypothetical protein [unclassified Pseudomonas]MCW8277909.1 hypothetical protein [Pseudomonas sp. PCH199]PAM81837.1 hypothetical protein CES87_22400 [Pseudomonas sp. ERMR1:02]
MTSAHKLKGLESPDFILHEDFPDVLDPQMPSSKQEDELNFFYVAVTRTMRNLVLSATVKLVLKNAYEKQKKLAG